MRPSLILVLTVLTWIPGSVRGGEIGFIEDFALARDRESALQQLIPGSEDFYYYQSLHLQQTQQFDQVGTVLQAWIRQFGRTPRVVEIQLRQALLTYDRNPAQSLETIRQHLNLEFAHRRESLDEKPNLPTRLDERQLDREALTTAALRQFPNLDGFEDSALDWLVSRPLDADRRRFLLQRLQRPDHPSLAKLIAEDLRHVNSGGFGSLPIHSQLLLHQLDELLQLQPDLIHEHRFVTAYLAKLQPSDDTDWRHDGAEKGAYLDRLWSFVSRLAPAHNSLKAHVLYHRLALDREQGLYDKQRFLAYLQLPRKTNYLAPAFAQQEVMARFPADLNADFTANTGFPPIGNDEPLVRDYLAHFFLEENSTKPYEAWVNDVYLRHLFAETKIVNGLGDASQWYALLPPAQYQALKERIDLDFVATNRREFAANEPVTVDLFVKNVRTLIVKVFEINTENFYRQQQRAINTDINLDGLVANHERTVEYSEPPLRRVRRHFEFLELDRPGVYVIDFIGNGMSSRVLIRKGALRHLVRTSTAGHVFTLVNEQNEIVKDGSVWLAGHEYQANDDGQIVVPYTDQPGAQPIVLSQKSTSRCSLETFHHQPETYALEAGIHVDRESLLPRKSAEVLVRPVLRVNGTPVSLSVLEEVRLTIHSRDLDGVETTKEVQPFELAEDREATFQFQTPPRLESITFTLSAKVRNLSNRKQIDLSASQSFAINSIDKTDKVEDLHLARAEAGYFVEVLGKTGEPKPHRAVRFRIKHRDFREPVTTSLQSDDAGRIMLGNLPEIESVTAVGSEDTTRVWPLDRPRNVHRSVWHAAAGDSIRIPLAAGQLARETVSLLELRNDTFVRDRFEHLSWEDGSLVVKGLPPGDFDLWLKGSDQRIRLRITDGPRRAEYLLGNYRHLESRSIETVEIVALKREEESLSIRIRGSRFARVHVVATRYVPEFDLFENLARVRDAELLAMLRPRVRSAYVAGRNIGDEYRYILDRKFAQKFPGVMVERPSLLINPWAVRSTETARQEAQEGAQFAPAAPAPQSVTSDPSGAPQEKASEEVLLSRNLDFLGEPAVVITNLEPDKQGLIQIPLEQLGDHHLIQVLAVDPISTAYCSLALPEKPMEREDLRLAMGLDPTQHFTQQKKVRVLRAGQKLDLADAITAKFEVYDSVADVYRLYLTLSGDAKLQEFVFILNWPQLKPEDKRRQYSKYACHELNFFLLRKDPEFFQAVVKPYLANKFDKTFLDRWLLGLPLDDQLSPWAYEQLNIVERILLAQRMPADREPGRQHVRHLFELLPPDLERADLLFRTALRGSALDAGAELAILGDSVQQLHERLAEQEENRLGARLGLPELQMGGVGGGGGLGGMGRTPANRPAARARSLEERKMALDQAESGKKENAVQLQRRAGTKAGLDFYFRDGAAVESARQLFQQLDKTQEWAENNYYKLPIHDQTAELVAVNSFWHDFAEHDPAGNDPFLSTHFPAASRNFTEMMFALALLDFPFESQPLEAKLQETQLSLQAGSPAIVFHQEIHEAGSPPAQTPVLVSQNYFQAHDRYRIEDNEQVDKFVSDEFLVHTAYGCQVVVTNPTSSPQKLDVLTQVPVGSIAIAGGEATRAQPVHLAPFSTQTIEYFFYFPVAGKYPHFPVHVSKREQLVAHAAAATLNVVEKLSRIDRESWAYVSQHGSDEQVLAFLKSANLQRIDLGKIAFRMQQNDFFLTVIEVLTRRHAYHDTLWSYGVKHNAVDAIREFLRHSDSLLAQVGEYLESPLVTVDPVERKNYEHLEYAPLVNARVHPLSRRRQILNDRFFEQYHRLLKVISYQRAPSADAQIAVVYYLLLQDRVTEANELFQQIDPGQLASRLQYDYFAAYLGLLHEDLETAEEIAARYADYPVDRWRNAFASIAKQIDESQGAATEVIDAENRDQRQGQLAATEPSLELTVEGDKLTIQYQNVSRVTVNYYLMDIELLFSQNPFVQTQSKQFANIRPNVSTTLELPADKMAFNLSLPETLRRNNVLVEVAGGGESKAQPYYANSLAVQVQENYGQLRVVSADSAQPLSKVYVKTYARMKDGSVRFYKDGYTDLRGRFDYASLSTNELDAVDRFALLVLSEDQGGMVREASPPKR